MRDHNSVNYQLNTRPSEDPLYENSSTRFIKGNFYFMSINNGFASSIL